MMEDSATPRSNRKGPVLRSIQRARTFDLLNELIGVGGKTFELRGAHAELLGRYLLAALEATRKPTPEHPGGEIMISPALKLMTGDKNLKTPRAADIIKQILRDCPETAKNPVLKQAFDSALSLRPRQSRGKVASVASAPEAEG